MDPNEALRQIRGALAEARELGDDYDKSPDPPTAEDAEHYMSALNELAERVEALDGWLSKGGFLPEAWRPTPSTDQDEPNDDANLAEHTAAVLARGWPPQLLDGFVASQVWREAEASARLDGETHVVGDPGPEKPHIDPLGGPIPGVTGHLPEDEGGH